jgi:hypothetical protein
MARRRGMGKKLVVMTYRPRNLRTQVKALVWFWIIDET